LAIGKRCNRIDGGPARVQTADRTPAHDRAFLFFLLCGLAFAAGYPRRELALATIAVAFAASLEILQVWIPGRHARFSDFLVDACAMLAGIAIASLLRRAHAAGAARDQHQMP
jgi:VanZ family protein